MSDETPPTGAGWGAPAAPAPKAPARPTPKAPVPPATEAERERGRVVGLAAVGAAAAIAIVVTIGIFLPAIGSLMSGGVRPVEADAIPASILVCDHEYVRTGTGFDTLVEARARAGGEPTVVGVGGGCVDGVCVRNEACLETVFVQTKDGRYVPFEVADASS
jgi:hypothetical protein